MATTTRKRQAEETAGEKSEEREQLHEALDQGHALVRIQDDQIQRLSLDRPRDQKAILVHALEELELVPELAAQNFYSIPFKDRSGGGERTTYVEGPSARAAENLCRLWGACAVTSGLLEERGDVAICVGTFVDYQSAYIRRAEVRVARVAHKRGGGTYRMDERAWQTAIASASSKAARNAALQGLPSWLKARHFDESKRVAANLTRSQAKTARVSPWEIVIGAYAKRGISADQLGELLGHALDDAHEPTDDELAQLRGLLEAARDGEVKLADVFRALPEPEPKTRASVDEILGASSSVTAGAERREPEPPEELEPPTPEDAGDQGETAAQPLEAPRSEPKTPAPEVPASAWNAKRACRDCGRHARIVEAMGHKPGCAHDGAALPELSTPVGS